MLKLIVLFATIAALVHVLFFCMESLWWTRASTRARFRLTEEEAGTTRLLALNQGFYNLFLAMGTVLGVALLIRGHVRAGVLLIGWNCLVMLGAAVVLWVSSPKMFRGALIQGLAPLLVLICFALAHSRINSRAAAAAPGAVAWGKRSAAPG